ncbi:glycosyltransferase family 4 protein [Glaesserella parasuis]|uniref:Putative glycosyltransferase n=1 Tax=Glaesserella parasuis TaxID=738 RepID=T1RP41_GLAPU|nr:putative glycosyltransferase [Glaesserella parasuis]EQA14797.1 glycosyl transferases group 1 family protein [Glaesserella parasuis H465]MDO9746804.1 glycosyltransferase family 4 protein [Glaesserella parasuis]MDO9773177.1 glycosyltransferase family 4 protein [Glaesserella parasuis]MDO9802916.1 glycosyltransferase family 4 protein [Glaesserella parasuis]
MKVLLLTQWFDPEPTFKGLAFAKELQKQGHQVQVLTGFPNYPGGKIYEGYQLKFFQKENIDGISILRVPLYPSHDNSSLRRIFNYISFALMAIIFGIFFTKKSDVIYTYHPPLTVGVVAIIIKFFRKIPVIYDIQDLWPDTLKATGMINNDKILSIINIVCHTVYKYVDHIVVLSPGFEKILIKRNVPSNKITVIYNWCNENTLDAFSELKSQFKQLMENKFNIVFAGNMGKAQALDSIIDVAKNLNESYPRIQFVMVGKGTETERLKERVINENIKNIIFIPQQPMSEVGAILQASDALLVHLKKDELFKITVPSKTQAYMSIGKPIIMAVEGDAADLVINSDCGKVAIPEDILSISKAIIDIYSLSKEEQARLAKNAKAFYAAKLSIQEGTKKFIDVFYKVI